MIGLSRKIHKTAKVCFSYEKFLDLKVLNFICLNPLQLKVIMVCATICHNIVGPCIEVL